MNEPTVYTIGQGSRPVNDFLNALMERGVRFLCDVRSVPLSQHAPAFCRIELSAELSRHGITYVSFSDTLGGRPDNRDVYRDDGLVDYQLLILSQRFGDGIARIVKGARSGHTLAVFCSEGRPERCHRSKAVGRALEMNGIKVIHVDVDGSEVSQKEVLDRLIPPPALLDLANDPRTVSRRRYR